MLSAKFTRILLFDLASVVWENALVCLLTPSGSDAFEPILRVMLSDLAILKKSLRCPAIGGGFCGVRDICIIFISNEDVPSSEQEKKKPSVRVCPIER